LCASLVGAPAFSIAAEVNLGADSTRVFSKALNSSISPFKQLGYQLSISVYGSGGVDPDEQGSALAVDSIGSMVAIGGAQQAQRRMGDGDACSTRG